MNHKFTATLYSVRKPTPDNPVAIYWWRKRNDPDWQRTSSGDEYPVVKGEEYDVVADDTGGGRWRHLNITPTALDPNQMSLGGTAVPVGAKERARDLRARAAALIAEADTLDGSIPDNGKFGETPRNAGNAFLTQTSESVGRAFNKYAREKQIDLRQMSETRRAEWAVEAARIISKDHYRPTTKEQAISGLAAWSYSDDDMLKAIADAAAKCGIMGAGK